MVLGYRYALRQMAEMENKGGISLKEISGQLKISTQQLKGLLEIMETMGHVQKVRDKNTSPLSFSSPSSCSGSCVTCGVSGCCGKNIMSSGTIYRLTEKGRKVCSKQTG